MTLELDLEWLGWIEQEDETCARKRVRWAPLSGIRVSFLLFFGISENQSPCNFWEIKTVLWIATKAGGMDTFSYYLIKLCLGWREAFTSKSGLTWSVTQCKNPLWYWGSPELPCWWCLGHSKLHQLMLRGLLCCWNWIRVTCIQGKYLNSRPISLTLHFVLI